MYDAYDGPDWYGRGGQGWGWGAKYGRYGITQTSAPAEEPVTLAEAKLHCRVDTDADNAKLTLLIAAARERVERDADRSLVTQTWRMTLDSFYDEILLVRGPHQSVSLVEYYDANNALQTLANTVYEADVASDPGLIRRAYYSQIWPVTRLGKPGSVRITFVAGYGAAAAVPPGIKQAVLLLVGHAYANREAVLVGQNPTPLPYGVDDLLDKYRPGIYR